MKIAIIETGLPPEPIRNDFPNYPKMFEDLLLNAGADFSFTSFSLCKDTFEDADFPNISEFDGFLITGSPAGVYENWPWMQPLFSLIKDVAKARKPQIGICFGHQAIAQALGGNVTKSDKGWGIGRHTYALHQKPAWIVPAEDNFSLAVSHQDQVVEPPKQSKTLASSDFCEFAALYYPDAPALSFQGHPEFNDEYAEALYNIRRGTALDPVLVDQANDSLKNIRDNNSIVAKWMNAFLTHYSLNAFR